MNARSGMRLPALVGAGAMLCVTLAYCAETRRDVAAASPEAAPAASAAPSEGEKRVSVAVARERAKLMHSIYAATLEVLHDRYFHGNRAVVPARAMEDVFSEISRQSDVAANWISVNTRAMSLGHEPKDEFEKKAAEEIAAGKEVYELVENGFYRRAGPIPLSAGCVSCHAGFGAAPPKSPRFAGLVIGIPVKQD